MDVDFYALFSCTICVILKGSDGGVGKHCIIVRLTMDRFTPNMPYLKSLGFISMLGTFWTTRGFLPVIY